MRTYFFAPWVLVCLLQNLSPAAGMQFFGQVAIDGVSEVMTVTLKDIDDHALWSTKIEPKLG